MIFREYHSLLGQAAILLPATVLLGACVSSQTTEPVVEPVPAVESNVVAIPEAQTAAIAEPVNQEAEQVEIAVVIEESQPEYDEGDVVWIQQRLRELGYYSGPADGSVGTSTQRAIENYQNDQALEADGLPTAKLREFMWRNGG